MIDNARPALVRLALVAGVTLASACASSPPPPGPRPEIGAGSTAVPAQTGTNPPLMQSAWPARTREHVDLWLHSYALIEADTPLVPYFRRGYRDRQLSVRRTRGVSTLLDANRDRIVQRFALNASLATGGQFLPLYFESWDQMRQMIDLFLRTNGNPGSTNDPTVRTYFALLGGLFTSGADREWLRLFTEAVDDESRRYHHEQWVADQRSRAALIPHVDSLWQRQWRPALQRFLNNTQQQNGELYLSLPIGGEGRTVHFGKQQNAIAAPLPDSRSDVNEVLYVVAHEVVGSVASGAIEDNTTPAERRAGGSSRYEQAAAVRAGAVLLERVIPTAVPGYMRFYLQQAGRAAPNDPRAAFASAFSVPDAVRDAIARQLEVILGGI